MWNIVYDEALNLRVPEETTLTSQVVALTVAVIGIYVSEAIYDIGLWFRMDQFNLVGRRRSSLLSMVGKTVLATSGVISPGDDDRCQVKLKGYLDYQRDEAA